MGNQQTAQTLTNKDVEILIKTSGKTEDEIRQWYNEFLKESQQTNRMTKKQFQKYYSKLRQNPKLEQITDHIFRAFDLDQSGTIDFYEFLLVYIATNVDDKRQQFDYAFEVYDINDDSYIDKKEARKILNIIFRIMGLSKYEADIYTTTMMISFDANQDKVLTKTEFINGCLHDSTLANISNPFHI